MRIYSMTATFGKLDHETLKLEPGLNIITGANEWGKSTWCAFLTAMLYGLDTRAKSTKTALADKERFAPWSGSPMSGKIELSWKGRDITIERSTPGRIPLGFFRAYETGSGLDVPELTAENCGKQLLGVERSVFLRSGFIRLKDMPVTEDEALRSRLNNLVTTGDESGSGQKLAAGLKELKNKIRYHNSGLLPEAQRRKDLLLDTLRELETLERQSASLRQKLDVNEDNRRALENHLAAMAYAKAEADAYRVAQAEETLQMELEQLQDARAACEELPSRETAVELLAEIQRLERTRYELQAQLQALQPPEEEEPGPEVFSGMDARQALDTVEADRDLWWALEHKRNIPLAMGLALILAGAALGVWNLLYGGICGAFGAVLTLAGLIIRWTRKGKCRKIGRKYGCGEPLEWLAMADRYADSLRRSRDSRETYENQRDQLLHTLKTLNDNIRTATEGLELDQCRKQWQGVIARWDAAEEAEKQAQQARERYQLLKEMAETAPPPEFPDRMTYSQEDTRDLLDHCREERQRLQHLLGQYQGRMETMGTPEELNKQIGEADDRITRLNGTYAALVIAQETLAEATAQLQRRFAPKIAGRARELMAQFTAGRYDRLQLREDFGILAGAQREDTLHDALWRSDGTVDQLYLALRLAVAGELMPRSPLVLDDALVRFDDDRLRSALEVLKAEGKTRQVLLFTCQSREQNMV